MLFEFPFKAPACLAVIFFCDDEEDECEANPVPEALLLLFLVLMSEEVGDEGRNAEETGTWMDGFAIAPPAAACDAFFALFMVGFGRMRFALLFAEIDDTEAALLGPEEEAEVVALEVFDFLPPDAPPVCDTAAIAIAAAFSSYFFLMAEFQWFLIALSVRPGNAFAITAHWLPCTEN